MVVEISCQDLIMNILIFKDVLQQDKNCLIVNEKVDIVCDFAKEVQINFVTLLTKTEICVLKTLVEIFLSVLDEQV